MNEDSTNGDMYEEIREYLSHSRYPEGASKREKGTIRRRSKTFQVIEGILYHKKNAKDEVLHTKVVTDDSEKYRIIQSYHIVNGSHIGSNRTASGISSEYYWKHIYSDVECWIQQCEVCQKLYYRPRKLNEPAPALTEASCKSKHKRSTDNFNNDDHDDASIQKKLHEEMPEKNLFFPVEATCKKGISSEMQPLSKQNHSPDLVMEAIEEESSGEIAQFDEVLEAIEEESSGEVPQTEFDRGLSSQESEPLTSERPDTLYSELVQIGPTATSEILPSGEGTQDVGQQFTTADSVLESLNVTPTPMAQTTPIGPGVQGDLSPTSGTLGGVEDSTEEENCRQPEMAEIDGSSQSWQTGLCCQIVYSENLPSQCQSLKKINDKCKNEGRLIPNGGLFFCQALVRVVKTFDCFHRNSRSLFGTISSSEDVHMIMPSSVEEVLQVFMAPSNILMQLLDDFGKDTESEEDMHRKGQLYDVKALEQLLKFFQVLQEEALIHVSQRIKHNLREALKIYDDSTNEYLMNTAELCKALECNKDNCVVEVHMEILGHNETYSIVCLKRENMIQVVEEWMMKNHQGARLSDKNLHLVSFHQPSHPVEENSEVSCVLHQVRLLYRSPGNSPCTVPQQPDHPCGEGFNTRPHQQSVQSTRYRSFPYLNPVHYGSSRSIPTSEWNEFQCGQRTGPYSQLMPNPHTMTSTGPQPSYLSINSLLPPGHFSGNLSYAPVYREGFHLGAGNVRPFWQTQARQFPLQDFQPSVRNVWPGLQVSNIHPPGRSLNVHWTGSQRGNNTEHHSEYSTYIARCSQRGAAPVTLSTTTYCPSHVVTQGTNP